MIPRPDMVALWALGSVTVVSLVSLVGLAVVRIGEDTLQRLLFVMVALAAGGLLGDAFLELLPEAYARLGVAAGPLALAGVATFYMLEHFLLWTHAHRTHRAGGIRPVGYVSLVADAAHNFTDGVIIGAAYLVNIQVGISTTIAVIAHEIPDELGNFFVLMHAGFPKRRALLLNLLSALTAVMGTALALVAGSRVESFAAAVVPFAGGGFIYVAGSDLLPEMHKQSGFRQSLLQLGAMAVGVGLIAATSADWYKAGR